ncbi:MAG: type III secretion system outer membrane ring subunit SctC, partial [Steroidobacteraceae bacterium]
VVRDRPDRMAFYEAVIRALDVKPGLVEIEARILEVSSDSIDSLGIDWRLHSGEIDLQFSRGDLPNLGFDTAIAPDAPRSGPLPPNAVRPGFGQIPDAGIVPPVPSSDLRRGAVLTTVLGDSGRFLIARINALAQDGKANVLATPRVMTLDNVEAVLENVNTFFVRVAGNLDVALFDLSAGTSLRVTPLIVTEDGKRKIKLAIRIEDGAITGQSVDQIPIVRRSSIGTQAFIAEGESLLIGGYESTAQRDSEVGIPGLSSVPVLGRLFKYREKQSTQVQRLFMLTPRVVER